jgi:hypothetical protein
MLDHSITDLVFARVDQQIEQLKEIDLDWVQDSLTDLA